METRDRSTHEISLPQPAPRILNIRWTVCPNPDCHAISLDLKLSSAQIDQDTGQFKPLEFIQNWRLLPEHDPAVLLDSIPPHLVKNYYEACAIKQKSPRGSASLARLCLQGLVRDKWEIKHGSLADELAQIKGHIDSELWNAIDAGRKLANDAVHLPEDATQTVEVRPEEAQLLLDLLEILFSLWYISAPKRDRLKNIILLADKKTKQPAKKTAPATASSGGLLQPKEPLPIRVQIPEDRAVQRQQ